MIPVRYRGYRYSQIINKRKLTHVIHIFLTCTILISCLCIYRKYKGGCFILHTYATKCVMRYKLVPHYISGSIGSVICMFAKNYGKSDCYPAHAYTTQQLLCKKHHLKN